MKLGMIKGAIALTLVAAVSACAGEAPGNGAVAGAGENHREAKFKAIGKANKAIKGELEKDAPSIDAIRANATTLAGLAGELPGWFPAGSGPESGIKTEAKPAIWTQPAEFATAAGKFKSAAEAFQAAATDGDIAKVRTAATELGATCKGCHDQFRQKK